MPHTSQNKERNSKAELTRFYVCLWGLHLLAVVVVGLSLFPAIYFFYAVWQGMAPFAPWLKLLALSFSVALGYFLFGTVLIFLCVFVRHLFGFKIGPGLFRYYSSECLHWMGYNSLILIANNAFLDVLRMSPFQNLFYRLMGAKVGKAVHVNTGGLADLALLEIGDHVVVGGGVALICHAFERNKFRLEKTRLGNHVSIGLGSVIMPGCEIGEGASVAPCSFLPRGTKIPPRGAWGGNPVRDLRAERRAKSALVSQ